MDIAIKNITGEQLKLFEDKERRESEKPKPTPMVEGKMEDLKVWTREEHLKSGITDPKEKIAREKIDEMITSKAEIRSEECWVEGCNHSPRIWVREVQFDLSEPGSPKDIAHVSTADYTGPVPGLCLAHEKTGSEMLAQAVWMNDPAIFWGYRPKRFIVIYTDGSVTEGDCISIIPSPKSPEVKEIYTPMKENNG